MLDQTGKRIREIEFTHGVDDRINRLDEQSAPPANGSQQQREQLLSVTRAPRHGRGGPDKPEFRLGALCLNDARRTLPNGPLLFDLKQWETQIHQFRGHTHTKKYR